MKRVLKAVVLSTTMALPAAAYAQSASQPDSNPCDMLLRALNDARSEAAITREQAEAYKNNDNFAACTAALRNIGETDANRTAGQLPPRGDPPNQTAQGTGQSIQVDQPAPQVTVTQAQPTVTITPGRPEIVIHQPAPIINVEIPQPQVTVRLPEPQVNVAQPEPQVSVNQAEPQVRVVPSEQQARTETTQETQPVIRFTTEEAQVNVTQADEPRVDFQQLGQDRNRQTADAAQLNPGAGSALPPGQLQPGQQGETQQVAVSNLEGKELMATDGNGSVGRITAVILDANDKPFVIVDKGGQMVAVDVNYTRMNGNQLTLFGVSDPNALPPWDDAQLRSDEVTKLDADQMIAIRTTS